MTDGPCKDCINKAEPRPPSPAPVHPENTRDGFETLRRDLGIARDEIVLAEALTLLQWAVAESRGGHFILSGDPESGRLHRLVMAALERVFRAGDAR